jgi:hypothetical protein
LFTIFAFCGKITYQIKTEENMDKHGSPADRGSADAYYGRPKDPHYWPDGSYKGKRIGPEGMTATQVREYNEAYSNEDDRKNWR